MDDRTEQSTPQTKSVANSKTLIGGCAAKAAVFYAANGGKHFTNCYTGTAEPPTAPPHERRN
jgi:hypothetical protein